MSRRGPFPVLLPAIALLAGAAVFCRCVPAAAERPPAPSLSEVLAIPEIPEAPLKDPFRPPGALLPASRENTVKKTPSELPDLPPLQLTAIVWRPDRASAVVNGTILREGDKFMEMQVLGITRDQVHFQRGAGKLSLILHQTLYNTSSPEGK